MEQAGKIDRNTQIVNAAERAIKSFQKANVRTQFKNNESKIVQGILSYESAVR